MLKKYINSTTIEDVPKNGVIRLELENGAGDIQEVVTGVSNLPLALESDIALANRNGYYEYVENDPPEYDPQSQYLTYEYVLADNVITKVYTAKDAEIMANETENEASESEV